MALKKIGVTPYGPFASILTNAPVKMDYAQNLKKDPVKAKKGPTQNFYKVLSAHYALLHYKEFATI